MHRGKKGKNIVSRKALIKKAKKIKNHFPVEASLRNEGARHRERPREKKIYSVINSLWTSQLIKSK